MERETDKMIDRDGTGQIVRQTDKKQTHVEIDRQA